MYVKAKASYNTCMTKRQKNKNTKPCPPTQCPPKISLIAHTNTKQKESVFAREAYGFGKGFGELQAPGGCGLDKTQEPNNNTFWFKKANA